MGKMKEKPSEPWKPSIIQNDSFISKNKKRKEKRLAKKLAVQKAETGDFIPVKKTALGASNKIKHAANGFELSPKNKKGNAFLSTSLPIKGNKKAKKNALNNSFASSKPSTPAKPQTTTKPAVGKLPKKVTGILSNPNTPKKNKLDRVTFEDDKVKAKKYLDDEAEEGEEPVTDKVVKPYEKKGKQKVAVQMEDDSDNDSDDQFDSAIDFMDMEASEGEETDDESDDEASGSDDDYSDEDDDFSSFLAQDDEDESCDEDEDDSDEDVKPKSDKSVKRKFDKMGDANEDEDDDSDESDEDEKPVVKPAPTSKNVKQNQPAEKQGKKKLKTVVETPVKSEPVAVEANKVKSDTPAKTKQEKAAEKKQKKLEQKTVTKNEAGKLKPDQQKQEKNEIDRPSNFIGFIRNLSSRLTADKIKSILSQKVDSSNILLVRLNKGRKNKTLNNVHVFLKDENSLENLLNHRFEHENVHFVVYKAKLSEKTVTGKPVAFLPRVPIWITSEMLKTSIEAEIGVGKISKIQDKKVIEKLQTRNVLVHLADLETLKKLIYKGAFKVDKETVIVREAVEAGLKIPMYRAVFADVPQDMTDAVLKKAIESSIGKNTIESIRFSFRKKSFAFVTFKTPEAQQKALALGSNFSIKGSKIRVLEFIQRKPKKRSHPSEQAKARKTEKVKRKLETGKGKEKDQQPSAKKAKQQAESSPVKTDQKKKKRRKKKPKKPASPAPTGEVKAVKNSKKNEKKKGSQSETAQAKKASPLKQKIEAKQANLKDKIKNKKKKAKNSE